MMKGSTAKGARHIMTPEDEDNDDAKDSVTALEWDPLSTDYLLVANKLFGIRLLDINAKTVITIFQTPTTAAQIQTLSWVHNAPGMFITGGDFVMHILGHFLVHILEYFVVHILGYFVVHILGYFLVHF